MCCFDIFVLKSNVGVRGFVNSNEHNIRDKNDSHLYFWTGFGNSSHSVFMKIAWEI